MSETTDKTHILPWETYVPQEYGSYTDLQKFPQPVGTTTIQCVNTTTGVKNPYWKSQVKLGVQAGTPFTGRRQFVTARPGMTKGEWRGSPWNPSWTRGSWSHEFVTEAMPSDPSGFSETKADNEALRQLGIKIRRIQTSLQGGVVIGELIRSINLIKNPAKALRKLISKKQGQLFTHARRMERAHLSRKEIRNVLADSWLEGVFGWRPLINDVDDGLKAFAESYHGTNDYNWQPTRGHGKDETVIHGSPNFRGSNALFTCRTVEKSSVWIRYIASVDVGSLQTYDARRMGMDYSNFLPSVWELIPYSFVIDYFTNIGDIISNASIARSTVRWVIKTIRKEHSVQVQDLGPYVSPGSQYSWVNLYHTPPRFLAVNRTVERSIYNGSLTPDFQFEIPEIGSSSWLNLAALYVGRKRLERYTR